MLAVGAEWYWVNRIIRELDSSKGVFKEVCAENLGGVSVNRMNLALIIIFLAGCSKAPSEETIETAVVFTQAAQPTEKHTDIPHTETPAPTQTPEPTITPAPTNTTEPTIAPTSLPEGVLFRDDFEGALQPGWSWLDEDPERWSFKEFGGSVNLAIVADNPAFFNEGYQVNTLARDVPAGEFAITAHIMTEPNENFKKQIYLYSRMLLITLF